MNSSKVRLAVFLVVAGLCLLAWLSDDSLACEIAQTEAKPAVRLQPGTLCAANERVVFSCPVRQPAKIVSVCASKNLTADRGYLQYRFGLPGKIEFEFPKERTGTQEKFHYMHYFRARFDLNEISFSIDGYEYQITDDYNGEEKPAQTIQRLSVKAPDKPTELTYPCRAKPKTDYTDLQAVLTSGQ